MVVDDLIGPRVHRGAVGHVDALRRDLHAEAFAQRDRFGEADLVDVAQREVGTATGQILGERATDAGPGAGDGGDAAAEVLHATATFSRTGLENTMASSSMPLIFSAR